MRVHLRVAVKKTGLAVVLSPREQQVVAAVVRGIRPSRYFRASRLSDASSERMDDRARKKSSHRKEAGPP